MVIKNGPNVTINVRKQKKSYFVEKLLRLIKSIYLLNIKKKKFDKSIQIMQNTHFQHLNLNINDTQK